MGIGDIVVGGGDGEGKKENKYKNRGNKARICSEKILSKLELKHRSSQVEVTFDDAKLLLENNSNWLKTKEAAEYLRTSPRQLRKWVYQGRIKAYKLLGKSLRFKKTELCLLIEGGQRWE